MAWAPAAPGVLHLVAKPRIHGARGHIGGGADHLGLENRAVRRGGP
jgi:hypothetical protein